MFDNSIQVLVAEPDSLQSANFKIVFEHVNNEMKWKLVNETKNTTSELFDVPSTVIKSGLLINVGGVKAEFKDFQITKNANGVLDPPAYGAFAFSSSGFPNPGPYQTAGTGLVAGNADRPSSNSQASGKQWGIHAYGAQIPYNDGSSASFMYKSTQYTGGAGRSNQGLRSVIPDDIEIRFTGTAEIAKIYTKATNFTVPFQVWNTKGDNDPSNDFRVLVGINDLNNDGEFSIVPIDHAISGGDNDPITDSIYLIEPLDRTPGEQGFNDLITKINANPDAWATETGWAFYSGPDEYDQMNFGSKPSLMRLVLVGYNLTSITDSASFVAAKANYPYPEAGTVFKIITGKPAKSGDYFSFTTRNKHIINRVLFSSVSDFFLFPNYPNPFNPETRIAFFLKDEADVQLFVFDLLGREVTTLISGLRSQGLQSIIWDGKNNKGQSVSSGVYFYKVEIKSNNGSKLFVKTNKMILLK